MKKFLLTIVCIIGLILGAILLWKVVFPFIGNVLGWIFSGFGLDFSFLK